MIVQPMSDLHSDCPGFGGYPIGRTRLISNPSGYAGETTGFDPNMTVELGK
ncbi:hypothetical protein JQ600_09790 [Bradyrhizobium sp. AUGA SZCCT0176]|uniref:hypothetical protein n=1 Tax=Bradyrhizobium sp. AUGA SZCCT0176 TaxID=2807664 RepID=UPI001BACF535|nr:hypothetical protein [Bradyrhizobium sp. AUGA SZCCT0176]MBR1225209.1 hypothetical protein [Bradyrhizobium sp. AUGA SZCCT0176]